MRILVTGGTGYIGSHICVELLAAGHEVVVADNLHNSREEVLGRVEKITGQRPEFHRADLLDRERLLALMKAGNFDGVVHLAGLKAVAESIAEPLRYYRNNLLGALYLCEAMAAAGVFRLVFSSSATVYGNPETVPVREQAPPQPMNPYGWSKLLIEQLLRDLHAADSRWNIALLRYFNPVGAHPSGLIGEDPRNIPNNLLPYISQVAVGKLEQLHVFGDDYPTPDGTGIRDYIHVMDLARGHTKALEWLMQKPGILCCNLGTGRGYSVLEVVAAFERACGKPIPRRTAARRCGDVAVCYADPAFAEQKLGWRAELDLDAMARDAWNWQRNNPDGYS